MVELGNIIKGKNFASRKSINILNMQGMNCAKRIKLVRKSFLEKKWI